MQPIAIGRLEQQNVRLVDGRWIWEDRTAVASEVAAEQERPVVDANPRIRRPEQMSGVEKLDRGQGRSGVRP